MTMVVFAGKRVGAALLSYLIGRGEEIALVVMGTAADREIHQVCSQARVAHEVFSKTLCARLAEEGREHHWLLNLWSPHLLPGNILGLAEKRLNLHPSLVPFNRGSDSTAWILRNGEPAGVSLIEMTEALDEGGVYAQKPLEVKFPTRGLDLHTRLQDEMIALFESAWPKIKTGELLPVPQRPGGSFYRRKETNANRVRDGASTATLRDTLCWMLAHDFAPGTTAEVVIDDQSYRIRLQIEKIP